MLVYFFLSSYAQSVLPWGTTQTSGVVLKSPYNISQKTLTASIYHLKFSTETGLNKSNKILKAHD